MPVDYHARAQTYREEAARLRLMAERADAHAAIEDGFADAVAREAEKRRALDRALLEQAREEERYERGFNC